MREAEATGRSIGGEGQESTRIWLAPCSAACAFGCAAEEHLSVGVRSAKELSTRQRTVAPSPIRAAGRTVVPSPMRASRL